MNITIAAAIFASIASSASLSPSERAKVQRVINDAGHRCDAVANVRPGAAVDNGDVLLIADCTDGSSHVITMTPDLELDYYMPCKALLNPVRC